MKKAEMQREKPKNVAPTAPKFDPNQGRQKANLIQAQEKEQRRRRLSQVSHTSGDKQQDPRQQVTAAASAEVCAGPLNVPDLKPQTMTHKPSRQF